MDLGVIKSFRNKFESVNFDKVTKDIENSEDVHERYKKINISDLIVFIDITWQQLKNQQKFIVLST